MRRLSQGRFNINEVIDLDELTNTFPAQYFHRAAKPWGRTWKASPFGTEYDPKSYYSRKGLEVKS